MRGAAAVIAADESQAGPRRRAAVSTPVRVAHVAARLPVGGMENVIATLVRGLPTDAFDCRIWCLEEADALGRELTAAGEPLLELNRTQRRDFGLVRRLVRAARAGAIDVLHCHDELSWFYGILAAMWLPRLAVVTTMHGRRGDISPRHRLEQRLLCRRTDALVSVSAFLRDQLVRDLRLRADKITLIINGVRLDETRGTREAARRALGLDDGHLVVGCVGELSPVKHFDLAVDAFAAVAASTPSARLVLVGDGDCRADLEAQAQARGLGDRIVFAGVRRDVPSLWPAFDVYLCSSRYEGTSLSVLEAMAASRAVVLTAVGGNPALVTDAVSGRLVPSDDAPAMTAALLELLGDPALRQRLGAAARAVVHSRYTIDATLDAYGTAYRRALAARRGTSGAEQNSGS